MGAPVKEKVGPRRLAASQTKRSLSEYNRNRESRRTGRWVSDFAKKTTKLSSGRRKIAFRIGFKPDFVGGIIDRKAARRFNGTRSLVGRGSGGRSPEPEGAAGLRAAPGVELDGILRGRERRIRVGRCIVYHHRRRPVLAKLLFYEPQPLSGDALCEFFPSVGLRWRGTNWLQPASLQQLGRRNRSGLRLCACSRRQFDGELPQSRRFRKRFSVHHGHKPHTRLVRHAPRAHRVSGNPRVC